MTCPTPPNVSPQPSPSIFTLGHPLLRQVAQPVAEIDHPHLQRFMDQMLAAVRSANGVGIAAPQLGCGLRVVVVASRPNLRYPQAPLMEPRVLINPRLTPLGAGLETGWEGCLSVPGVRGRVDRHRAIAVDYLDRQGQPQHQVWEGFVARIVQHEVDHLEGKVFLDRVVAETDVLSEDAYQSMAIAALG